MATIADNLSTLQVIKLDIKNAINSKGGSANDDFRTYANAIEELPSGGGDDTLGQLMKNELTTYNIPNGVTNIKNYFFASATTLINITIPNSVTSIGDYAFYNCSGLTKVTIPDSVTTIGNYVFYGCSGLTSVTIPNSVTSIGSGVFFSCDGITSITIPNSVRNVGGQTFQDTKKLANVYCNWLIPPTKGDWFSIAYSGGTLHVPNGSSEYYKSKWTGGTNTLFSSTLHWNIVEDMGDYTPSNVLIAKYNVTDTTTATRIFGGTNKFASGATSASTGSTIWIEETPSMFSGSGYTFASVGEKEIRIDSCPSTIPNQAFNNCSNLTSVTIPNSVTSIGGSAFLHCSSLTSVTIGNSVTSIGQQAFDSCSSLTSIAIPNSVTYIDNYAFSRCESLLRFNSNVDGVFIIPDSVTNIGGSAFLHCSSLTSVTIGNSVTSIGQQAFDSCSSLTSIAIPNSVTSIEQNAFNYCKKLTSITYNGTKSQFTSITKGRYWKNNVPTTCIVHCTDGDYPISDFN